MSPQQAHLVGQFLVWAYGVGFSPSRAERAAPLLAENPWLREVPTLKWAAGDVEDADLSAKNPLGMTPIVAVAASTLLRVDEHRANLTAALRSLLDRGANPNDTWIDPEFPNDPLSALYAASGRVRDLQTTRMLLKAGANPNDNESLYHACEGPDGTIVEELVAAGAKWEDTNALARQLDFDNLERLHLALRLGAKSDEKAILHALKRGRGCEFIKALTGAGAKPSSHCWRFALALGQTESANHLESLGCAVPLTEKERWIAACASGDEAVASDLPNFAGQLSAEEQKLLPLNAAIQNEAGVRLMVRMGWDVNVNGGEIGGTALNHAVFTAHEPLIRFLLAAGTRWDIIHAYNDTVWGTLSWVSRHDLPGDHAASARALKEGGVPVPEKGRYAFSESAEAALYG